ncbi:hypothetical protein, partial [Rothia mucilaginosa]|uniref:hypothetical protein n=2 Tax=Micrococcaceae TaxID=1268 RepID=UPI00066BB917
MLLHKSSAFTITALAGALLLSSCAQGGASNSEYKAKLDYANNLITLPLDEYDYDDASRAVINEAVARIMQVCYVAKGYSDAVPVFSDDQHSNIYGAWNVEYAKKYGYFNEEKSRERTQAAEKIPAEIRKECRKESANQLKEIEYENDNDSFAYRLRQEAYASAKSDPEWNKVRSEWWSCLESNGLTPRKDDQAWGSQETSNIDVSSKSEEEKTQEVIRLATIEAECNQKVGMAQRLGDIEASYQGPLIEKNQAK